MFDPATGRNRKIYPPQSYAKVRDDFIARVAEVYRERGEEWFRKHNHHMNPEWFDSSLASELRLNEPAKSISFAVRFGDLDNASDPLPFTETVRVSCAPMDRIDKIQCVERPSEGHH
jgi:hypothetical protein